MSCNYADGLSPYDHKGVLGAPEKFDDTDTVDTKCSLLADWISNARHVVFHTGAGISTTAGIPDFRGPNGVWTLEKKGLKPTINISFDDAVPTKTHMALKKLVDVGYVKYIVSQNIDGLHLKSGLQREFISELHGNMFAEQCDTCYRQFIRSTATTSVGQKSLDKSCPRGRLTGRACRGKICDTILDWEANLPEDDLKLAELNSSIADLNVCLGTTLQIVPSGNLPLSCKKYGGKVAIINLQKTKHDKKADLILNTYVDVVLEKLMKRLGLEIPEYSTDIDPSRNDDLISDKKVLEWSIFKTDINKAKKLYDIHCKNKKRKSIDSKETKAKLKKEEKSELKKVEKTEICEDKNAEKTEICEDKNAEKMELEEQTETNQEKSDDMYAEKTKIPEREKTELRDNKTTCREKIIELEEDKIELGEVEKV